jgi:hypothetical protein
MSSSVNNEPQATKEEHDLFPKIVTEKYGFTLRVSFFGFQDKGPREFRFG